jgi:hypothetical protein
LATTWLEGGLGVASGAVRDAIPPVPPKTAKSRPQPPKSAIESHLRFAESFGVHRPISTSEFAAVSTPPPRNNLLRYSTWLVPRMYLALPAFLHSAFCILPYRLGGKTVQMSRKWTVGGQEA